MGECGLFFAGMALWLGIALSLIPEPAALISIIPVSPILGVAVTNVFARWGAASMMQFAADRNGIVRVIMDKAGVIRVSKRIGCRTTSSEISCSGDSSSSVELPVPFSWPCLEHVVALPGGRTARRLLPSLPSIFDPVARRTS